MKKLTLMAGSAAFLLSVMASCNQGNATREIDQDSLMKAQTDSIVKAAAEADSIAAVEKNALEAEDIELIKTIYKEGVFGTMPAAKAAKKYCGPAVLKRMADAFEYDCEDGDCYAIWELRTVAQDGDGASRVVSVDSKGDGWYSVKYLDQGYEGITDVKMENGKIVDYKKVKDNAI